MERYILVDIIPFTQAKKSWFIGRRSLYAEWPDNPIKHVKDIGIAFPELERGGLDDKVGRNKNRLESDHPQNKHLCKVDEWQCKMSDNSICLFTTIRATLDDSLAFAYYHLNIGVDRLFLFFDDPGDPAVDALDREKRVTCIRCDPQHWADLAGNLPEPELGINAKQRINSQVAIKMAREQAYAWIGHIDSDELIYAPAGLKETIAALPQRVQIARMPVLEAIPEKLSVQSPFQELCRFKYAPVRLPKNKSVFLDPRQIVPFCINNLLFQFRKMDAELHGCTHIFHPFIKGHRLGKSIVRTSVPMDAFLSHFPVPAGHARLQISLLPDIKLLHYYAPDYERWKVKWQRRYAQIHNGAIPLKLGPHEEQQFNGFVNAYEQGNEDVLVALYRSIYFISRSDLETLQEIGLTSEIHLPDALFAAPTGPDRPQAVQG